MSEPAEPPPPQRRRLPIIGLLLGLMMSVFVAPLSIVYVEPGHGGVLWRRFGGGTVLGPAIGEGVAIIAPWDRLFIYDLRLQTWEAGLQTLTSDGLSIMLDVVLRFRVSPDNLSHLHVAVGREYVTKLIRPQVEAAVHASTALYPIEQLVGPLRIEMETNILRTILDPDEVNSIAQINRVTRANTPNLPSTPVASSRPPRANSGGLVNTAEDSLDRSLLLVVDIMISRIVMPDRIRAAIEAKLEQKQRADEYEYRLMAERAESERKVIEADGIRRFQEIVNESLTPGYLTLRGIQATEALSRSANAKTIIIGGSNGLPLILNAGAGAAAMATTARAEAAPGGAPERDTSIRLP